MSRMSDYDQDTRENESGLDMSECEWHEYERNLLNQIGKVTDGMVAEGKLFRERMNFDSLTNAIRGDKENPSEQR